MSNADRQGRRDLRAVPSSARAHYPGTSSSGVQNQYLTSISECSGNCTKTFSKRKHYSLSNFIVSL